MKVTEEARRCGVEAVSSDALKHANGSPCTSQLASEKDMASVTHRVLKELWYISSLRAQDLLRTACGPPLKGDVWVARLVVSRLFPRPDRWS